jgi:hypothetical protein
MASEMNLLQARFEQNTGLGESYFSARSKSIMRTSSFQILLHSIVIDLVTTLGWPIDVTSQGVVEVVVETISVPGMITGDEDGFDIGDLVRTCCTNNDTACCCAAPANIPNIVLVSGLSVASSPVSAAQP